MLDRKKFVDKYFKECVDLHRKPMPMDDIMDKLTKDLNDRYFEEWAKFGLDKVDVRMGIKTGKITHNSFRDGTIDWYLNDEIMFYEIREYDSIRYWEEFGNGTFTYIKNVRFMEAH